MIITPIDVVTLMLVAAIMAGMIIFYKMIRPAALQIIRGNGDELPIRQTVHYETSIVEILRELKIEFNVSDVYLARFHNGGNFTNGTRMKKFSVPYEIAMADIKELVRWRFYDKFCSHWADVIDELFVMGEYLKPDISNKILCRDDNFRKDMDVYGFMSVFIFLICQQDKAHTPEGFLALNYTSRRFLTQEDQDSIKSEIPKLLSLMNLTTFKVGK
jgi:hypothetical protein